MSFPTVDRYADLVKNIISGSFYDSEGVVVPYRSGTTSFRLETNQANTEFGIYINEIFSGTEISDVNGNVVLKRKLPLGENQITILSRSDGRSTTAYLTVREYALWLASYGDVLEDIDTNIIQARDNVAIKTSDLDTLQNFWGEMVHLYPDIGQGIEVYKDQLGELRQAYRDTGSRYRGLEDSIAVLTQIPPFGYARRKWGPNWVLDQTMLVNHRFLDRSHTLTNATNNITGLTLVKAEPDVMSNPITAHQIQWDATARTLTWVPDGFSGLSIEARDGELFLPGPSLPTGHILAKPGFIGPFLTGFINNHKLYLNIDNRGTVEVTLSWGLLTVSQIVTAINNAFLADPRYGFSVANSYNSRVLLLSTIPYGSVEIEHGASNGASNIFGVRPGDIHVSSGLGAVLDGVDLVEVQGSFVSLFADATIEHLYDETLTVPHRLRWKSPYYSFIAYTNIPESGSYVLYDSFGNSLDVDVSLDDLNTQSGAPLTETINFRLTYNRKYITPKSTQGLWVDLDLSSLPAGNATDTITIYDDVTDSRPETPDYWSVSPYNPATLSTFLYPSFVRNDKIDDFDPTTSFLWSVMDPSLTSIDIIGHVERFPLINDTPRGSNFPQKNPGLVYDYEGYELVFSGWFMSLGSGSVTVRLDFSFDGGANWVNGTSTSIIVDAASTGYETPSFVSESVIIPSDVLYRETPPLPYQDSGILVRAHVFKPVGNIWVLFDSLNASIKYISSQALGSATVARSRHRQYFGELLWLWAPEELTLREKQYLGLTHKTVNKNSPIGGVRITVVSNDTPNGTGIITYEYNSTGDIKRLKWEPNGTSYAPGFGYTTILSDGTYTLISPDGSTLTATVQYSHLPILTGTMPAERTRSVIVSDATVSQGLSRTISPAHSSLDIFDVTEYDSSGLPINLKGIISEGDFSLCGLINCDIQNADPFKYSYVYPDYLSQEGESLSLSLVGPDWVGTLSYYSDEDQENAILYEDGVPVPNDWWSFTSPNTIAIPNVWFVGGYLDTSATFTIDYDLLYQVETPLIDLGPDFQNYMWLVDTFLWTRYDKNEGEYFAETPLYFNVENGKATLPFRSNMDRSTSRLYVQQSTELREIPQRYWSFLTDSIVQIELAYLVDGQYYLEHYEKRVYEQSDLTITLEHKSGETSAACLAATYTEVERNENVDVHQDRDGSLPHSYHQLRLSISGVRDLSDFKVKSLVLKGLKIHGSSPYVPGLTNVWST